MKSIAFIHDIFPSGGAERVTIDIAKHLTQHFKDYRCFVLTPNVVEDMCTDEVRRCITIIKISPSKKLQAKEVERIVLDENIKLIFQVVQPRAYVRDICRRTGCKTIFANHGEPFWERYAVIRRRKKSLFFKPFWRLYWKRHFVDKDKARKVVVRRFKKLYKHCDIYTVLCDDYRVEMSKALGVHPDNSKIVAIENSERVIENVNYDKQNIIMFCGRLENTSKRLDRLLRIWGKVQHRLPDYRLLIVGDGSYRGAMEQQIAAEGLERVDMVGQQSDVDGYYRKASIVALTSQYEGWGLCLTEGQAHGCIPIAFGCSAGVRDILSPSGVNGFVVTPYDEDEYAETLVRIASMSVEEREVIRRSVVAKRAQYSPEVIMKKWCDLIESL
jgi:glycosyltransferase involved in cell wall biosynthesis